MQLSRRNIQNQRHETTTVLLCDIFFPLCLLHFFLSLPVFLFPLSSCISQGQSHEQLQSLPSDIKRETTFVLSFNSKMPKEELIGRLGQFHQHSPTSIIWLQDAYRNHVIVWYQDDFCRNHVDEVELGGTTKRDHWCFEIHASLFLREEKPLFSLILYLCLLRWHMSLKVWIKCHIFHKIFQCVALHHESSEAETI